MLRFLLGRSAVFLAAIVAGSTELIASVRQRVPDYTSHGTAHEAFDTLGYARRAWETVGRQWVEEYLGLQFDSQQRQFRLSKQWAHANTDVAQQAYYAEYVLRPALNLAMVTHDVQLLDELADLYVAFLPRFSTLGELRSRSGPGVTSTLLNGQGSDTQKTLGWIERTGGIRRVRECQNCTAQFLHPAARLLRAIALMPAVQRTPMMERFARAYVPIVVHDHLLRLAFDARPIYSGVRPPPLSLVAAWSAFTRGNAANKRYEQAVRDRDLWLIATAAEVLGANAADSSLVPLGVSAERLREIVITGVRFVESRRSPDRLTRNFSGKVVGSVSYFNGDNSDYPDMAFSGYVGERFPTQQDRGPNSAASWDISHAYRIPIFIRSLADTRGASGTSFPSDEEIRLITNQYAYRVFNGNLSFPLFRNFFDGTDGWYRVGYASRTGAGTPPSALCDSRLKDRPCLARGALMGWGQLAPWNSDLSRIERAVISLTESTSPAAVDFRQRYYGRAGDPLTRRDARGAEQHSMLLFGLVAEYAR
jgi:hypothetical protein